MEDDSARWRKCLMVYESVVDEVPGGIGLFCVLFFPASFKLMVDIMPRRSASQKGQV
jgi:hypothetical protein